jgi:hypothetical protein
MGAGMPAVVEFRTVVEDLLVFPHNLLANEPERWYFVNI